MMTRRSRAQALLLALLSAASLSCDRVTAPAPTGTINLALTTEALDSVRVTASGATAKTVMYDVSPGVPATIVLDGLLAGAYEVIVEGFEDGLVAQYGVTSGVNVSKGYTSTPTVALSLFQPVITTVPDTARVLHFTVEYSAVTHATSYIVDWSQSHTFATVSSDTVTGTSTEIVVPEEGRYYFKVRAVNSTVTAGGFPSPIGTVYALQAVANVVVLPATPSIVDGTTQQFTAAARDADNTVLTGITFFWASSNNAVATVSQTGLVTSVSSGTATISAVAKGVPGDATLTVTPQASTKLVFTSEPTHTVAGQAISSIQVAIQNPKNQTATSDDATQITIAITNPAGAVLSGTAIATVVDGVATFNNLSINKAAANYTFTATATSLATATSAQFNITPGDVASIEFTSVPSAATAGAPIAPAPQVEFRDNQGNRVTSMRNRVTLSLFGGPVGATLSGTKTVNAIDGVASFSGLSINLVGGPYSFIANAPDNSLANAQSTSFAAVGAGVATTLAFTVQPVNATADDNVNVTVSTRDGFGNVVSSAIPVTLSIGSNPAGGTLSGTTTLTTASGSAVFNNVQLRKVGADYTLIATAQGSLTPATSVVFGISPGTPDRLAFAPEPTNAEPQGPIGPFDVIVQDAHGNQTNAAIDVSISFGANPAGATLFGTTMVTSSGGVATFSTLTIDGSGDGFIFDASSPSLGTVTSSGPFDVFLEFASISAGEFNTCGITTRGSAYCWGDNLDNGRLGNGQDSGIFPTPQRVLGGHTFSSITTGYVHTCGLRQSDGAALCWGESSLGKLGNGVTDGTTFNTPQLVNGGHSFVSLSAAEFHTCGIRASDNVALCWGFAAFGRLGNNTTAGEFAEPQLVDGGHAFRDISAGRFHTCAVKTDATAYCWGRALFGRLGNNDLTDTPYATPQLVQGGFTYKRISAGTGHSCAIGAGANVDRALCWGQATFGKLGNGTTTPDIAVPAVLPNGIRYSTISAGFEHTCGVGLNSGVFCWGQGTAGQLGNATVSDVTTPVAVVGGLVATRASAAVPFGLHSCAITTTGAFCWGRNDDGELGDGTNLRSSVPVRVKGSK